MKLNKKITAGMVGLVAAGTLAATGPALAQTDTETTTTDATAENEVPSHLQDLVDDGTITQEQLDTIVERFSARDGNGRPEGFEGRPEGVGGPGGFHGQRPGGPAFADSDVVADALGLTADELSEARQSGQSISEIASANGVDVNTLIAEMVQTSNDELDEKVASGEISSEDAEDIRSGIEERVTNRVNGERPDFANREFGRFGGPRTMGADA